MSNTAIILNAILSAASSSTGALATFPPNQPNQITIGNQVWLKTGVIALQSAFPKFPFASVGAWGASTIGARGFIAASPICFGAGVFVASSTNFNVQSYFYWSVDGKTWNRGATMLSQYDGTTWGDSIGSIIWDGAQFVALGSNSVWTSADGKNWVFKTNLASVAPVNWGTYPSQILYGNGLYIALGGNGGNSDILYSTNLVKWTYAGNPFGAYVGNGGTNGGVYACFDGTQFVYLQTYQSQGIQTHQVFYSANGYSGFTQGSLLFNGLPVTVTAGAKDLVSLNGNIYFQNGTYTFISTDHGVTFNGYQNNSGKGNLAVANGYFYCGGDTAGLQISADAKSWRNLVGLNYPNCYVLSQYSYFGGLSSSVAYGNYSLVTNTNDTGKTLVFSGFGQYIDNFLASNSGGNPYYLRVQ